MSQLGNFATENPATTTTTSFRFDEQSILLLFILVLLFILLIVISLCIYLVAKRIYNSKMYSRKASRSNQALRSNEDVEEQIILKVEDASNCSRFLQLKISLLNNSTSKYLSLKNCRPQLLSSSHHPRQQPIHSAVPNIYSSEPENKNNSSRNECSKSLLLPQICEV